MDVIKKTRDAINKDIDNYHITDDNDNLKPFVCLLCDRFIDPSNRAIVLHKEILDNKIFFTPNIFCYCPPHLLKEYDVSSLFPHDGLENLILSPRASKWEHRKKEGFSCCRSCKLYLGRSQISPYFISNGNFFGECPECLQVLTDVELTFITPVKKYGYIYTYTGGKNCCLRGVLSFYHIEPIRIARACSILNATITTQKVIFLLSGKMTPQQRLSARKKAKIRIKEIFDAITWLCLHNSSWKNIDLDAIEADIKNGPVLIDRSSLTLSEDNNIESTESFNVYFPDYTMTKLNAGQESQQTFQSMVEDNTFGRLVNAGFYCDLTQEYLSDINDGEHFVKANILQFPYGRGGLMEPRVVYESSHFLPLEKKMTLEFLDYYHSISILNFHRPSFVLLLYSMKTKSDMFKSSCLIFRNTQTVETVAKHVNEQNVRQSIRKRKHRSNEPGDTFLNAIDSVTKAIPHSNESANVAKHKSESLQDFYGNPSVFLTVSPDDTNCFNLLVFGRNHIDYEELLSSNTADAGFDLSNKCKELRTKYPGVCGIYFEFIIKLIGRHVVGWNFDTNSAYPKGGLFGHCSAAIIAIEEQGRKSLHMHILIWVKELQQLLSNLSLQDTNYEDISKKINAMIIGKASCSLVGSPRHEIISRMFHHQCTSKLPIKSKLVFADEQDIRNLRHRCNYAFSNGAIVFCSQCNIKWNSEEIACLFLKKGKRIQGINKLPEDIPMLSLWCLKHQANIMPSLDACVINTCYNRHSSKHVSSCFRRSKQGSTQNKCNSSFYDECRMRYPRLPSNNISIDFMDESYSYYHWNGVSEKRYAYEIIYERSCYDVFQNIACPCISESKLTCNTNISFLCPGPILYYITKYQVKSTQDDDCAEYTEVLDILKKEDLEVSSDFGGPRREAFRKLLRSCYAHNKANIIGTPLASYLMRNNSRFLFSEEFAWCPMFDIYKILTTREVNGNVTCTKSGLFFNISAMHYLCRPSSLEDVCSIDFYSKYEVVVKQHHRSSKFVGDFIENTDAELVHPCLKNGYYQQGTRERKKVCIPRTNSWILPDTSLFNGSLFTPCAITNEIRERYCMWALIYFVPFRHLNDLAINGCYHTKFIECIESGEITEDNLQYLQNIQDRRYNNIRQAGISDSFINSTSIFHPRYEENDGNNSSSSEEYEEDEPTDEVVFWDDIDRREEDPFINGDSWDSINFAPIKDSGAHHCGYLMVANVDTGSTQPILEYDANTEHLMHIDVHDEDQVYTRLQQGDIVKLISTNESRHINTDNNIDSDLVATGSTENIITWARHHNLDREQRRAFEIIVCSFLFYYYVEATNNINYESQNRRNVSFNRELQHLEMMYSIHQDDKSNKQLLMFLHGPGGSGKSRVIDLVLAYCKNFCSNLNQKFSRQSIVVTALSGVAATLLKGETTHRSLFLNCNPQTFHTRDNIELWELTRLIIIDEISFASREMICQIDKNLRLLGRPDRLYGGFNIVFSGDFRQLDPISGNVIYKEKFPEWHSAINCFIELKGLHRFSNNPLWGQLLLRLRDGIPTEDDLNLINQRLTVQESSLPDGIQYVTYSNKDRDAINIATFEKYCHKVARDNRSTRAESAVVIFCSMIKYKNKHGDEVPLKSTHYFFEHCGESTITMKNRSDGRLDPVLKVYQGCPLMLTSNISIEHGQANGTVVTVDRVVLHENQHAKDVTLSNGIVVKGVFSHQVKYIQCRQTIPDIQPQVFCLKPETYSFRCKVPGNKSDRKLNLQYHHLDMSCLHFNCISNTATTGHKLQGKSVNSLFIHTWSYTANWAYVVLSRVRDINGLFIRHCFNIQKIHVFKVPEKLTEMLNTFRREKAPSYNYRGL